MDIKSFFIPFIASFASIALAELGDKTQLISVGFATKYRLKPVIAGILTATSLLVFAAIVLGKIITEAIPLVYVQLLAAFAFLGFGTWTLISNEEGDESDKITEHKNPFWSVFGGFLLAELGDKTQLATIALVAAFDAPVQVWLGATLGMILVNLIGVFVGNRLQHWLNPQIVKYVAAALFITFGLVALGSVIF